MILPIVAYGAAILRTAGQPVTPEEPGLQQLIAAMWRTLDNAGGVGLAAQQVNKALQLFIVDSTNTVETGGIRQVFLNARILEYSAQTSTDTEGCLSIPGIWEEVPRAESITITYTDEHFTQHTRRFTGPTARMIQHEYDHTRGKLYLDHLSSLRRRLLQSKLQHIIKGRASSAYPMRFS
ncbi:peptide deformylase [Chitinophaga agrisoli]|uniref:Peptide deformylase n=1 Tax=Chitinophaga agrisoli TaxID=2607653 RepID=A0A5B2W0H3_9BACT|nr:peptide deformylase [Chitinophaga agrisoli]KAA2245171.1 peptide deformylase [Chitinophaga agrisoli]